MSNRVSVIRNHEPPDPNIHMVTSEPSLSAPVGQSNSRGGGANRLERITALARDQIPVQDEIDQIADMSNNQANLHILENFAEYRDEDGEPRTFRPCLTPSLKTLRQSHW